MPSSSRSVLASLESRLNALHETHKSTLQLINRLASLKFTPGTLLADTTSERIALSSEIHEVLKREDEELEVVQLEVDEFAGDHQIPRRQVDSELDKEYSRLVVQLTRLKEDYRK